MRTTTSFAAGLATAVSGVRPAAGATERWRPVARGDLAAATARHDGASTPRRRVGGPRDGGHRGRARIAGVRRRLTGTRGGLPEPAIANLRGSSNPNGPTVPADVGFAGRSKPRVRHAPVFRADRPAGEARRVDPAPPAAAG